MTPDEAQHAIRDAEYIGANLPGECWRALDTIAGMREEWGIVTTYLGRHEVEEWGFDTREHAESDARLELNPTSIVRRYVTEPEEIE